MEISALNVLWADAHLIGVRASYDTVELSLRETNGRAVVVTAVGQVGYQLAGFWDETVIESADIVAAHPFAALCLSSIAERLGDPPPATGSPSRDLGQFATLVVSLSDGAVLLCSAADFQASA